LLNGQELAGAKRPALGRKVECEQPDFAEILIHEAPSAIWLEEQAAGEVVNKTFRSLY
jgi:hypothetical protein